MFDIYVVINKKNHLDLHWTFELYVQYSKNLVIFEKECVIQLFLHTRLNPVANVNNSHSSRSVRPEAIESSQTTSKRSRGQPRVKSKVVVPDNELIESPHTQTVNFEEDGEEIQMEINDGGAAATEFASDAEAGDRPSEIEDQDSDD